VLTSSQMWTSVRPWYTAYDYSGRTPTADESAPAPTYTAAQRVVGREPASGAAAFSAATPLVIPAPAPGTGLGVTACAWVRAYTRPFLTEPKPCLSVREPLCVQFVKYLS